MANVLVNELSLTAIADAIREKNGETTTYKPGEMAAAIVSLPTGGGGDMPEEAFTITGDCQYRFASNGWNWFIDLYGNKIKTKDITNVYNMFANSSELESIPFEINFKQNTNVDMGYMFAGCKKLKHIPNITVNPTSYHYMKNLFQNCSEIKTLPYIYNAYPAELNNLFQYCYRVREIPEDYFDTWNFDRLNTYNYANVSYMFQDCYSLRKIPSKLFEYLSDSIISSIYYVIYYSGFSNCYVLDEIVNLPVLQSNMTSNLFSSSFANTFRLKRMTFQTNEDGTVKTANWKSQVIDLKSSGFREGWSSKFLEEWGENDIKSPSSYIINYNSGITIDKAIYNQETYNLLKDDVDAYCIANGELNHKDFGYSRYNRISAVETINSLPDTSAYLATAGGTNTIKFKGEAGAKTDGGAINTLTEEEIAVAAAKGWTVSFA